MKTDNVTQQPSILFVYDPALCCSSGVCGVDADQVLIQFSADIDWLKKQGIEIKRFNLAQEPMEFATNNQVKAFLEQEGADKLPVLLVGNDIKKSAVYPTRQELATWFNLTLNDEDNIQKAKSSCCNASSNTSSKCC